MLSLLYITCILYIFYLFYKLSRVIHTKLSLQDAEECKRMTCDCFAYQGFIQDFLLGGGRLRHVGDFGGMSHIRVRADKFQLSKCNAGTHTGFCVGEVRGACVEGGSGGGHKRVV